MYKHHHKGTYITLTAPAVLLELSARLNDPCDLVNLLEIYPTGSRYTCDPPVLNTDEDWLVYCVNTEEVTAELEKQEWARSEQQGKYPADCISYRMGRVNIIVVFQMEFYLSWIRATEVCRLLNVQDKQMRKQVHRIVCGEDQPC